MYGDRAIGGWDEEKLPSCPTDRDSSVLGMVVVPSASGRNSGFLPETSDQETLRLRCVQSRVADH